MSLDKNPVPIITPFNDDLSIDLDSFTQHLDFLYKGGITAIIIGGTTGEGLALSDGERHKLVSTAKARYPDIAIWGGITTFNRDLRRIIRSFQDCQCLLVMPPFFVRPSSSDIIRFYKNVLHSSEKPIVVYNNPARTMVSLTDLYPELLVLDARIAGVKETDFTDLPANMNWWCGEDSKVFQYSGLWYGLISAAANIAPSLSNRIAHHNISKQDEIEWQSLVSQLSLAANPLVVKYILWQKGIIKNYRTRFPVDMPESAIVALDALG